jgi:hypothetical protein
MCAGRPSKLTPELQRDFCLLLSAGTHPETVCNRLGITRQTFGNWKERGERALEAADNADPDDLPYLDFMLDVLKALGEVNGKLQGFIFKAAEKGNWPAAAYLLSKRMPHVFGDKVTIDSSGNALPQGGAQRVTKQLSDEQAAFLRRKILYGDKVPRKPTG